MKRLTRTLVVIHLFLAIAVLALGILLFQKRQILVGRTQKLETALSAVASTIEVRPHDVTDSPDFPARDIAPVTARSIQDPEGSPFWETYRYELESGDDTTIDLRKHRDQLAQYYRLDPITLKPMRDPATREKLTHGEGTMQELLDEMTDKAMAQYNRLQDTRDTLASTREELVDTVTELNTRKQALRVALSTIVQRDTAIAGLQQDVRDHQDTIRLRDEFIDSLKSSIVDLEGTVQQRDDQIAKLNGDVRQLSHQLAVALGTDPTVSSKPWAAFSRGVQGKIAGINEEWNFAVLQLTPRFLAQYRKMLDMGAPTPSPDLTVIREGGAEGAFVAKLKLTGVNPEDGLGIADILSGWQQGALRVGDTVLY